MPEPHQTDDAAGEDEADLLPSSPSPSPSNPTSPQPSPPPPVSSAGYASSSSFHFVRNHRSAANERYSDYHVLIIGFSSYDGAFRDSRFDRQRMGSITHGDISNEYDTDSGSKNFVICDLPWGGSVSCYARRGYTNLFLPPFAEVIGLGKDEDAFDTTGTTIHEIPYGRRRVSVKYDTYINATHIAFRNLNPARYTRYIARRVYMVGGNRTYNQVCESGPIIKSGKSAVFIACDPDVIDETKEQPKPPTADIIVTSIEHRLVHEKEVRTCVLHPIPKLHDTSAIYDMPYGFVPVHLPFFPYVIAVTGILMWLTPGIIQWIGGQDRHWASLVNQCIGTGSVLVGFVTYIVRKNFGIHRFREAVKGNFSIRNDAALKALRPQLVRKLQTIACDPRIPSGLIAEDENCCVRAERNGWLSIGNNILVSKAHEHGYHVLKEHAVMLDIYDAKLYRLANVDGKEHILRQEDLAHPWDPHVISPNSVIAAGCRQRRKPLRGK